MNKALKLTKYFLLPHRSNAFRPHAFRHKALSLYSLGLIVSQLFFGITIYSGPALSDADKAIIKNNIVTLTNGERTKNSIQKLYENSSLDAAAESKLNDMFSKNYWDHTGPSGETAWDFISDSGYRYLMAGENLARGFSDSNDAVRAWMESNSHRANILNDRFSEIGVAVGTGKINGNTTTLIVQLFGEPKTAFAASKTQPNQVLSERKLLPDISAKNATTPNKIPYFVLWIFIFAMIVMDGVMIRKLGLHASRSHLFNFRVSLLMSFLMLALLTLGFTAIA